MNARVFLLLLVTGLFMAAWNGDQAAKQQFLAQRAQQRAALALVQSGSHRTVTPATTTSLPETQLVSHAPQPPQIVTHFRPDGMAAGVYRAVSETGVTFELTIANSSSVAARDFYVADSPEGHRWYFVRVKTTR